MDKEFYISLIYKELKEEISVEELQKLETWLAIDGNLEIKNQVVKSWELSKKYEPTIQLDEAKDLSKLLARIRAEKAALSSKPEGNGKIRPLNSYTWMARAASFIVLLGVIGFVLLQPKTKTVATHKNEVVAIELADGSTITLNENSKVTYPKKFKKNQRKIKLNGEAFFEVERNQNAPFSIETPLSIVTVLGTSFNVDASKQGEESVYVKTGKVKFDPKSNSKSVILQINEKSLYKLKEDSIINISQTSPNETSWINNVLTFEDTPLSEALEDINNHFKINVSCDNSDLNDCLLTARFSKKSESIILEYIAKSFEMKLIKINDKVYQLKEGKCR